MFEDSLKKALSGFGMEINEEQAKKMRLFYDFLIEKNKVMNLTAITGEDESAVKHFADSLYLFKCAELKGKKILDIGSGAGFPGMPLLIYDPSLDITMLDSTQKRIDFINESRKMLGLGGSTVCARAEEYALKAGAQFDIVTSRAVAPLNILTELSMYFLKKGGLFMPMKSSAYEDELAQAQSAVKKMGGLFVRAETYPLMPGLERSVLIIQKADEGRKPRRYAQIVKKPL